MAKVTIVNTSPPERRVFARNVTLDNIPKDCKVYCFVFGSSDLDVLPIESTSLVGSISLQHI